VALSELSAAEKQLIVLKQRYADNHPDVKALIKRVETLKKQSTNQKSTKRTGTARQSNPLSRQIRAKIAATEREIIRLNDRESEIKLQLAEYERRIVETHQVQRAYTDLTRDHENNLAKYQELKAKQLEAELAQNLESENKGESFTLIEPPLVSFKPEKPNRLKILAMGVVASLGVSFGLALLLDMIFGGVRGYNAVTRIVGQAPLVVIPLITTASDLRRKVMSRKKAVYALIILFLLSIIGFHFFVMSLEIFWFKLMRKISLL
jgi:uncharacterized protein involved in exopolysaccharide biosynthesis